MITESSTDSGETTRCHRFTKRHGLENERLLRSFIRTCKISNALDGTDDEVMKILGDSMIKRNFRMYYSFVASVQRNSFNLTAADIPHILALWHLWTTVPSTTDTAQ